MVVKYITQYLTASKFNCFKVLCVTDNLRNCNPGVHEQIEFSLKIIIVFFGKCKIQGSLKKEIHNSSISNDQYEIRFD